jgi:hypothetical protein
MMVAKKSCTHVPPGLPPNAGNKQPVFVLYATDSYDHDAYHLGPSLVAFISLETKNKG